MDQYGLQRIARIEHEQMIGSLPPVSEFGCVTIDHPGWAERLGKWMLRAPRLGWFAIREHSRREIASLDTTVIEHVGQR